MRGEGSALLIASAATGTVPGGLSAKKAAYNTRHNLNLTGLSYKVMVV